MRRRLTPAAAAAALAFSACGPAQVAVSATIEVDDPATGARVSRPLSNLEIQLLPFDRDQVFDSMARAAATPEPEIPPALVEAQTQVAQAQQEWRDAENRWKILRDTLARISAELQTYSRGEARYVVLFREFGELEGEYGAAESRMNVAFARFDSLQKGTLAAAQEIRVLRENWANDAFADVGGVFRAQQLAAGRPISADTTGASGAGTFEVPAGRYWIHARYELPYSELYWNVPVDAQRGNPVQVQLTRANARERPKI